MRRTIAWGLVGALAAAVGWVTAVPASARGPQWTPLPAEPFTLPKDFCGFRVYVATDVNKEFGITTQNPDGSTTIFGTGVFKSVFENLKTKESITENVSGPFTLTIRPDGSATFDGRGLSGVFLLPSEAETFGLPDVFVYAGPITLDFDPEGNVTALSAMGTVVVDICAALS